MGAFKRGIDKQKNDEEAAMFENVDHSDSSDSDDSEISNFSNSEDEMSINEDDATSSDDEDKKESEEVATEEAKDEEEDELLKAIKEAKEAKRNHPPNIIAEDCIVDICFHPVKDLLAVSTIVGDVAVYKYSDEENELIATHELHSKACRDIEFSDDGDLMFSTSKDKSIMVTDFETGKLKRLYENAHDNPVYCLRVINENTITTGDDEGFVRMWDIRCRETKPLFSLKVSEDYISDMLTNSAGKYLVCSCGDGALSTINMSGRKIHVQSEEYESELTCLGLFRGETKILAGSSKGKLFLFNWGEFGLHSDEFTGQKQYISCMVPITDNIAVVSGEDGILRATHLFPHKQLGIVGQHSISVERMDICNDGTYIASCSHNNDIKFWNISYFNDMNVAVKKQNKRKDLKNNLPSSKARNASDFFAGMS